MPGLGRSTGEAIGYPLQCPWLPCGSAGKESACNAGDLGSIAGLGRSTEEGNGYPLQYSGLEIPWTVIRRVTKSGTRLSDFHFETSTVSVRCEKLAEMINRKLPKTQQIHRV